MNFDGISQFVDTFVQSHVKFHMCGFEPAPTPNSGIRTVFLNQQALNERLRVIITYFVKRTLGKSSFSNLGILVSGNALR